VRQALTVATAYVSVLFLATLGMLLLTDLALRDALFETASALATVGLSTGVTADLPAPARDLLVFLMFLGRIGPLTLASSLALRERPQQYRLPEEQPIIG
jgi:Trk-type K+ transport system membrane component